MTITIKDANKRKSYTCNATKAADIIGITRCQLYKWRAKCIRANKLTYTHNQFEVSFDTQIIPNKPRGKLNNTNSNVKRI